MKLDFGPLTMPRRPDPVEPPAPLARAPRSLWGAVRSLFVPWIRVPSPVSPFDGDPDQDRRERPLPSASRTEWYQSDIHQAISLADGGDLALVGQLWRATKRDGIFGGLLSTRAGGLIRLPRTFRAPVEVMRELVPDPESGRASLFDRVFPSKELELLVGDGIGPGVGVGELLRIPGRAEPLFVRLDPEFLRYRWSEDRWFYASAAGLLPVTPGDGRWILHMPGGYQQPWNNGQWHAIARAFVAKEHAFMYRENYSGKLANPARVAVSPQGASEEQRQGFFKRVMAWGLNTVFGLPPGWDVRLLEINGQGFKVFQDTIDASNKEFAISIAGQTVTVDGGAGFSNATIHETIRSDLIQGDGAALSETLNLQAMPYVMDECFGAGFSASVAWDTAPPTALKEAAEALSAAVTAIVAAHTELSRLGYQVNVAELISRFKIPAHLARSVEVEAAREISKLRRAA